jgi:ATP-dependent RNA helicase
MVASNVDPTEISFACIGGKSLGLDLKELERGGAQIISGTPGRVYDLIRRNALNTSHLKAMILDEGV